MSEEMDFYKKNQCMNMAALVSYYETISERLQQANIPTYPDVIDGFINDFEPLAEEFYYIYNQGGSYIPYDFDNFKVLLHQEKQLDITMSTDELIEFFAYITEVIHQQTLILVQATIEELNETDDGYSQRTMIYKLLRENGIVEQLARFELCFASLMFKDLYEHGLTFVPQPPYSQEIAPDFQNIEFDGQVYFYRDPNLMIRRVENEGNIIAAYSSTNLWGKDGRFVPCITRSEAQYFKNITTEYIRNIYSGDISEPKSKSTLLQSKKISTIKVGSIISLGEVTFSSYWDDVHIAECLDWQVLRIRDDNALVISKDVIEFRPYHNDKNCTGVSWEQSDIRNWLNSDFFNGLSFKERILPAKVVNDKNREYETPAGPDTVDKVFLLSIEEASWMLAENKDRQAKCRLSEKVYEAMDRLWRVAPGTNAKTDRQIELKHGGSKWILRSPGEKRNNAAQVLASGRIGPRGTNVANEIGIRPVFWISDIKTGLIDR